MNAKLLTLSMLVSLATTLTTLVAYHKWPAASRAGGTKVALLDVAEIYRLKESQFSALIMKPGATEPQRAQAIELARTFGLELAELAKTLPAECDCLVLTK